MLPIIMAMVVMGQYPVYMESGSVLYETPVIQSYSAPVFQTFSAPVLQTFSTPVLQTFSYPAVTYSTPVFYSTRTFFAAPVYAVHGRTKIRQRGPGFRSRSVINY